MGKYNLTEKKEKNAAYRSLVRAELVDELYEKILKVFVVDKKYRDPSYSAKKLAEELNVPLLGQIPIVQSICEGGDQGKPVALNPDSITGKAFQELAENVVKQIDYRNEHLAPTERVIVTKK